MSPVAKRGPPTSGLSMLSWRFSPASHRPADTQVSVPVRDLGPSVRSLPPAPEADRVKKVSARCCSCRCFQLSNRSVSGKAVRAHHNVYFQAVDDLSDILLIVRTGAGIVAGDGLLEPDMLAITGLILAVRPRATLGDCAMDCWRAPR